MVRAKFKCVEIRRGESSKIKKGDDGKPFIAADGRHIYEPCELRTVRFSPVYANNDPNHENSKFWEASPSGTLELGCINLTAAEAFELGKEYYLDFSKSD